MVQPAFEIGNNDIALLPADGRLLIEVSGQSFNYLLYTRNPDQLFLLRQYRMYTTSDKSTWQLMDEIISGDPVLQMFSGKADIIYNFPNADIIPAEHYNRNLKNTVAALITGSAESDFIFDERVHDWNIYNIYRVSKDIHALCREKFKEAQYWHLYTVLLLWSRDDKVKSGKICRLLFYNDRFVIAYFNNRELQLVQTFNYQTPEDVAYYLLLLCRQFAVTQEEIVLNISGLIDSQSPLYSEILKYFAQVHYEGLPVAYQTNGLLDGFPDHYFSPLLKMSLCV